MSHPLAEAFYVKTFYNETSDFFFLPPPLLCLWILDERSKVNVATGMYRVPEAHCPVSIMLEHAQVAAGSPLSVRLTFSTFCLCARSMS